ncbi:hypothetical protein AAFA46_05555 [Oscillospiraceae bacterium WX1]
MDLTPSQTVALKLIVEDLRFVYSVMVANFKKTGYSYPVALQPYLGLITDGIEQWGRKVNAIKNNVPMFTEKEKEYYVALRNNIKLWENEFSNLSQNLEAVYNANDDYFANECKPIAKLLKIYNIYGCLIIDGFFCDNTILDSIYSPYFNLGTLDSEYTKTMSEYLGRLLGIFGVNNLKVVSVNTQTNFQTRDFCGFFPAPTGYREYDKSFILFSIMCTINFLIFGIDKYVLDEIPTKLRFIYIQYFYLVDLIKEINKVFQKRFYMNEQWYCRKMRNCLGHYGLGSVLQENDINENDAFGGLTNKLFNCDWRLLKNSLVKELWDLSEQLRKFLKISN